MPSLLVIEDGTQVAGANSYATAAEARTYASARGVTLSAADSVVEQALINACDYLDSLEPKYKGSRVASTQALAWPRQNVFLFSSQVPLLITAIPDQLKRAQCQLTVDIAAGNVLQPTGKGQERIRQKTDVIETEWQPMGTSTIRPVLNKALEILSPLLIGGGLRLSSLRV